VPRSQNTVRTGCFARAGNVSAGELACHRPVLAFWETRRVVRGEWSDIWKLKMTSRNMRGIRQLVQSSGSTPELDDFASVAF
jgi:hypothetical protein